VACFAAVIDISNECRRAILVNQNQVVIQRHLVTVAMHDISVNPLRAGGVENAAGRDHSLLANLNPRNSTVLRVGSQQLLCGPVMCSVLARRHGFDLP
jgi:hypothetical protein